MQTPSSEQALASGADTPPIHIRVQQEAFIFDEGYEALIEHRQDVGALVSFTGLVRDFNETPDVTGLTLEHYPGMTEKALTDIAVEAASRWALKGVVIVHRVGHLRPGDPIVQVVVASAHRRDAFSACDFIMDILKTRAPFWKKEHSRQGDYWVKERATDFDDAARW
ncbi:molybdopterin synthase catalytic subunit MoaE [Halomonas sp. PAMB 3232]|uniref:molybdopterin synthase catalytic subunit MoaE n=1 Tax=Halomonas sp. PAMB 3232 TaxID=3075221 RepID=UPI0028A00760|nr:molybdopterin synthase catalytic subunit MoaE [Halomonas sp. PAMB 3232]WNL37537.1 molybdopterin synthase catalytic subunit MoaE [Halomonas sp. PAMB 3232]